jgi:uncharacterized membrane protein YcgQ (UPF0703/DUF1980 family)
MNDKSTKLNLLIAMIVLAVTSIFFIFQLLNTKWKLEEFNKVLGKDENVTIINAVQTLFNDNRIGTFDENVKFTNAAFNTGIIEIKEKMFIAQTNDVYLNSDDYLGKTIKLEGLFKTEDFDWQERPFYYVLRYGPGCCGYDGSAGFEVMWEADIKPNPIYPKEDDWVEAIGIVKAFNNDGIYIALTKLTILNKRGNEFVRQ